MENGSPIIVAPKTARSFDLDSFVDTVRGQPVFSSIVKKADELKHLWSIFRDLQLCQSCLNATAQMDHLLRATTDFSDESAGDQQVIGGALVGYATIIYCRTIDTNGRRQGLGAKLIEGLTPDQKAHHDEIVTYRNEVLAHHVHNRRANSHLWLNEKLTVLAWPEHMPRLKYVYSGYNYRAEFNNNLARIVSKMSSDALAWKESKELELLAEINSRILLNPLLQFQIFSKAFNPDEYFKGDEVSIRRYLTLGEPLQARHNLHSAGESLPK